MAVIIHNISGEYRKGIQTYNLRINNRILCTFEHEYEKGLPSLLRKAADEFEEVEREVKKAGG